MVGIVQKEENYYKMAKSLREAIQDYINLVLREQAVRNKGSKLEEVYNGIADELQDDLDTY